MTYPQETKEYQPISVTVDGVEVLTGVKVSVIPTGERPSVWTNAATLDNGKLGVLIDSLTPGVWCVWAQVTTIDELPVIFCGTFRVTN